MSDNEWGLSSESSDVEFGGIDHSEEEEDEEEELEKELEELEEELEEKVDSEGIEDKVAQNVGEKLESKLSDNTIQKSDINWARDGARERFGVTLRRHIVEGTIDELQTEYGTDELRENLESVLDIELLNEVKEKSNIDNVIGCIDERIEQLGDRSTDHLVREGQYDYLPVFGFNINHVCTVPYRDADADDYEFDSIFIGDKLLSWWERDSITPFHPYLLLNPIDSVKNTNHTADDVPYREIFRLPKGRQLAFCDSGGFQMVSRDVAGRVDNEEDHYWQDALLHPETVLDWQINNADAGPILDHPPYVTEGESSIFSVDGDDMTEWIDDPFYTYLQKTAENAHTMSNHLESRRDEGDMRAEDYKMFGVIQGHTFNPDHISYDPMPKCLEEDNYGEDEDRPHWYMLERWHDEIRKPRDDWRGWALSPTPCTSPGQIALHLSYAHNNCEDAEWFHVLQVGSAINISLIQFYSMIAGDKFITSDASSHNRGSKYRQFMLPPGDGGSVKITDREDKYERHPCNCKVCETVENEHGFEYIGDGADSKRNATMNLHNLTMQLNFQRVQNSLMRAREEEVLAGLKLNRTGDEIRKHKTDFWKTMMDATTKSKIKQIYNAMLYLYSSMENGMQEKHDLWVKDPEYLFRDEREDEDEEDLTASIDLSDGDMSGGSRGTEEEEEEVEEEEEIELTPEEEHYLGLDAVVFEEPNEEDSEYYNPRTVRPDMNGEEMTMDPCKDISNSDW